MADAKVYLAGAAAADYLALDKPLLLRAIAAHFSIAHAACSAVDRTRV